MKSMKPSSKGSIGIQAQLAEAGFTEYGKVQSFAATGWETGGRPDPDQVSVKRRMIGIAMLLILFSLFGCSHLRPEQTAPINVAAGTRQGECHEKKNQ